MNEIGNSIIQKVREFSDENGKILDEIQLNHQELQNKLGKKQVEKSDISSTVFSETFGILLSFVMLGIITSFLANIFFDNARTMEIIILLFLMGCFIKDDYFSKHRKLFIYLLISTTLSYLIFGYAFFRGLVFMTTITTIYALNYSSILNHSFDHIEKLRKLHNQNTEYILHTVYQPLTLKIKSLGLVDISSIQDNGFHFLQKYYIQKFLDDGVKADRLKAIDIADIQSQINNKNSKKKIRLYQSSEKDMTTSHLKVD